MVVIRLARGGAKKRPFYNIVAADSRNRRLTDHRDCRIVEDPVLEFHQFHVAAVTLGNLIVKIIAGEFELFSLRRADVRRQRLAHALVETNWVIQQQLRDSARGEPGEAAVVSQSSKRKTPIARETMPAKECRFDSDPRHRFDGISNQFADVTKRNQHQVRRYEILTDIDEFVRIVTNLDRVICFMGTANCYFVRLARFFTCSDSFPPWINIVGALHFLSWSSLTSNFLKLIPAAANAFTSLPL